jgi:WD40 repeat protein
MGRLMTIAVIASAVVWLSGCSKSTEDTAIKEPSATVTAFFRGDGRFEAFCSAFSADGRLLACGSTTGWVFVIDTVTGKVRSRFKAWDHSVNVVQFTPDGTRLYVGSLAAGTNGPCIQVYDPATGRMVERLADAGLAACSLAFPDAVDFMAGAASGLEVWVWDIRRRKLVFQATTEQLSSVVAVSADGKWLAAGGIGRGERPFQLSVWNLAVRGKARISASHRRSIMALAFSPNGATLASGSDDKTVRIWEVDGLKELRAFEHVGRVREVAFSSKGDKLVAVEESPRPPSGVLGRIRVWELGEGKQCQVRLIEDSRLWGLSISKTGKYVAGGYGSVMEVYDSGLGGK